MNMYQTLFMRWRLLLDFRLPRDALELVGQRLQGTPTALIDRLLLIEFPLGAVRLHHLAIGWCGMSIVSFPERANALCTIRSRLTLSGG